MTIKYYTNQMLPSHIFITQIREVYHNRGDIIFPLRLVQNENITRNKQFVMSDYIKIDVDLLVKIYVFYLQI